MPYWLGLDGEDVVPSFLSFLNGNDVADSRRDDDDREEDYGVAYNQDEKKALRMKSNSIYYWQK